MTRRLWAVATASLLLACGGESGPNGVDAGSIEVTPDPVVLAPQASVELHVAAYNADGVLLSGVSLSFTSKDEHLVTVSSGGLVQSVGPAGTTSITVKAGRSSVIVPVTVTENGRNIRVLPEDASLPQLGTLQLHAALLDPAGTEIAGAAFSFVSSDQSVASVDQAGLVSSAGPAGQVTISVSSGELTTQKTVSITQVPTSITLLPNSIRLGQSSTIPLGATVRDAAGSPIADAAITYSAEPSSLLAVSATGVLSAQGTPGTGSVTAASGTLSVTVPVTVFTAGSLTGTIVRTVSSTKLPFAVAMGDGDTYYGVGVNGQFEVGDFGTGSLATYQVSNSLVTGVAVDRTSGRVFAAGNVADGVMEMDPANGTKIRRWKAPDQMYDLAISPDRSKLYVAGSSGELYVVSTASLTALDSFPIGTSVIHLLAHPSQPLVYASGLGTVTEINVETGATRTFSFPAAQATALAVNGTKLFIAGEGGTVGVMDLATGETSSVAVDCQFYDLVLAPDGTQLLGSCNWQGKAVLLDATTFEILKTIETGGGPRRVAIKPDGTGAIIANEWGWYTLVE